jgi:hypothetical protein
MARVWRNYFAIVIIAACASNTTADTCFDDDHLKQLEHADSAALVYVWSPRMLLSAQLAGEVRASAQALGLAWLPVVDARLSAEETAQALQALQTQHPTAAQALARSQPLCSAALERREAYRHFPSAYVLRQGAGAAPIVGAMPPEFWRRAITQRLVRAGQP